MHKFAKITFKKKSCILEELNVPILQANLPLCPFNFYIETSPFVTDDLTIIHTSTVWEISDKIDFETTLFTIETKDDYKEFIIVPSELIKEATEYYVRAYFVTSKGESDFSEALPVSTQVLEYEDIEEADITGSLSTVNSCMFVRSVDTQETVYRLMYDAESKCISIYRYDEEVDVWTLVVSYTGNQVEGPGIIESCGAKVEMDYSARRDPSPFSFCLVEGVPGKDDKLYFTCLLNIAGVYKVGLFVFRIDMEVLELIYDDSSSTFKRDKQGICFYENSLFLLGGYEYDTEGYVIGASIGDSALLRYSFVTDTLTEVPIQGTLAPAQYRGTQCVVVGTKMYTFGGYGQDFKTNSPELWCFDFDTATWIAQPMLPFVADKALYHLSKDATDSFLKLVKIEDGFAYVMLFDITELSWNKDLVFSVLDNVIIQGYHPLIHLYSKNDKIYITTTQYIFALENKISTPTVLFPVDSPILFNNTIENVLVGSAFDASEGIVMTSQHWRIVKMSDTSSSVFETTVPSTGETTVILPANTLESNTIYYADCEYVGKDKHNEVVGSGYSKRVAFKTSEVATGNSWVAKPVILTPAANSVIDKNVPLTLTASAFSASSDLEYLGSEWQASGQAYFMNISSGFTGPTEDPTTITFNPSEVSNTNCMYVRVHYMGRIPGVYDDHVSSERSEIMCYNFTPSANINQPTLILPEPNPQGTEAAGTYHIPWDADGFHISCAPFATTPEGTTTHAYSIWSMNDEVLFNASNDLPQCYWTSGKVDGSKLTEIVIPTEAFKPYATTGLSGIPGGMVYSINVVHVGADGSYSVKSDWLSGYKTITVGPVTKISKPFMESPPAVSSWEANLDCTQEITFTGTPFSCFTEYYVPPNNYIEAVDPSAVPQIQEKTYWKIETIVDSTLTIAYQTEILGSSNTLVLPANTLVAGKTYYVSFRYLSQSLGSEWCNSWTYRT